MTMGDLTIIGERINPGFRSSKAFIDNSDFEGIQNLAIKQAEAGASFLNINIGSRALDDSGFMSDVIKAIQDVVDIPLSFDFPSFKVQEICLNAYDSDKANGAKPIINSIAEPRWEMADALKIKPSKIIVMASERLEDGVGAANKEPEQILEVAKRVSKKLINDYGLTLDDIILDVSITTLATPGHSPGHFCYLFEGRLVTGDILFCGKVGGTGSFFPGSSARQEYDSLHRLLQLPADTLVFPGHDYYGGEGQRPHSTVGFEKENNPFLTAVDFDAFCHLKDNWAQYKEEHDIR